MALTGCRLAEIFFSAFSLRMKLPYPALIFDGQLKTVRLPAPASSLTLSPSWSLNG